jgi:transcriptional regulator with XRE-family HTH domain
MFKASGGNGFHIGFENGWTVGERIRALRRRKKLSQTAFGKIVGRSMNGMAMIERGEADPPIGLLLKIADALETDWEFIVTGYVKEFNARSLTEADLDALTLKLDERRQRLGRPVGEGG